MKDTTGLEAMTESLAPAAPHVKLADSKPPPPAMPSKPAVEEKPQRTWNTKNIGLRLAADFASASAAASMIAPLIAVIDKFVFHLLSSSVLPSCRVSSCSPFCVPFFAPIC
jgi:hypothetical protein